VCLAVKTTVEWAVVPLRSCFAFVLALAAFCICSIPFFVAFFIV
jgi:hypothetical protein